MATGTIKTIRDQGFGFIARDGSAATGDLFFHHSAVHGQDFVHLQPGDRVTFDEESDPRDPSRRRAVHVQRVDAPTGEGERTP